MRRLLANARRWIRRRVDAPGAVLVENGKIAGVMKGDRAGSGVAGAAVLDLGGLALPPALSTCASRPVSRVMSMWRRSPVQPPVPWQAG